MNDISVRNDITAGSSTPFKGQKTENGASPGSFSTFLEESIKKVNDLQLKAENAAKELSLGKGQNLHSTMIAIEKADISFKLMMQLKNKLLAAYQEIMRMQV